MFKDELIIIRHARSKYNVREDDDLDSGLTDFGLKQAANMGRFLATLNLAGYAFRVSPFLRCLETAHQIWLSNPWVGFSVEDRLGEYLNHSGEFVDVPSRKCQFTNMNWAGYPIGGMRYETEFNEVFLNRMHAVYTLLPHRCVVVTHGLPAITLARVATELNTSSAPVWDYSLDNASITVIRRGRMIWWGRNLYHEKTFNPKDYRREWDQVGV